MWSIYSLSYQLYSFQDISLSSSSELASTVVLGLIKKIHVRESILNKDGVTIDLSKIRPVARLGGTTYAHVLEGFDLPRISWKAVAEKYDELAHLKCRLWSFSGQVMDTTSSTADDVYVDHLELQCLSESCGESWVNLNLECFK